MIEFDEVYELPVNILEKIDKNELQATSEMSSKELAFICGLIKKYKPQKIVEIGVAAGGTTSVILNCLSLLKINSEIYSIDLANNYYRMENKQTGFLVDYIKEYIDPIVKHHFCLGNTIAHYIEKIGGDIDFLILDTAHVLPGELMDFILCVPYLSKNATIVLHDVNFHQISGSDDFATKILFDTVVAKKILPKNEDGFSNIAAFKIEENSIKYIENCFSALTLPWKYYPEQRHMEEYERIINKNYTKELVSIFNIAKNLNYNLLFNIKPKNLEKIKEELKRLITSAQTNSSVYLYGCGNFGKKFLRFFKDKNIQIKGFIVSDNQDTNSCQNDIKTYHLSNIDKNDKDALIILTIDPKYQREIEENLKKYSFSNSLKISLDLRRLIFDYINKFLDI